MEHLITAVDIDVSKGKSMVAVRRPEGTVVLKSFKAMRMILWGSEKRSP